MASVSAPTNTQDQFLIDAAEYVVLVGPDDGSKPTLSNEVDWLIPLSCSRVAGGNRDDVMMFGYFTQPVIVDTKIPKSTKVQVELRALDSNGDPTFVLGWGQFGKQTQKLDDSNQMLTMEVRIGDQHFGKKVTGYTISQYNPVGGLLVYKVNRDVIFNPEVDGIVRGNRNDKFSGILTSFPDDQYFIDWGSITTLGGTAQQWLNKPGQNDAYDAIQARTWGIWTVQQAIVWLCRTLNPDETFILNPTLKSIKTNFAAIGDAGIPLKNVHIPFGASLPDALDILLTPLSYGWYLWHYLDYAGERQTAFAFYLRGNGPVKSVKIQRPAATRDVTKTNVTRFDCLYSVVDLANRIECWGDFEKRESTFRLSKGWNQQFDNRQTNETAIGNPFHELHREVGRRWILNEAGDYDDDRTENVAYPWLIKPIGFSQTPIAVRREFLPCLSKHTVDEDQQGNGVRVDWYDWTVNGATNPANATDVGWTRVTEPYVLLERECGILFTGASAPEPLWRHILAGHPERALVRITATVVGDVRMSGIAPRQTSAAPLGESVNGLDMTLVLDVSDRFQNAAIDSTSIFAANPTDATVDSSLALLYAQIVRGIEDVMRIDLGVELEGVLHPELFIGDILPKVTGRNLSLIQNASGRSPQIVGFNWNLQGQRLEVMVESFKRERPQVMSRVGRKAPFNPDDRFLVPNVALPAKRG